MFNIMSLRYERRGECCRCGQCCKGENCEHLFIERNGTATCMIHDDPSRPEKCDLFPFAPPIVFSSCGYSFADLWDNGRIVKGVIR